jgi:hypothetical protein
MLNDDNISKLYTHIRGHKLVHFYMIEECSRYLDSGIEYNCADIPSLICPKCKKKQTKEGHDNCLGTIKNVKQACCGHGIEKGYVVPIFDKSDLKKTQQLKEDMKGKCEYGYLIHWSKSTREFVK